MLNSPITYNVTQNVFTKEQCKDIIDYAMKEGHKKDGKVGGDLHDKDKLVLDPEIRKTDLIFFSQLETYNALMPFISSINNDSGWKFDLQQIEPLQLGIYREGGHYDWHIDVHPYPYHEKSGPFSGLVRKISFSVLLNDSSEYKGGEFEIEDKLPDVSPRSHIVNDLLLAGSMITFPSYIPHKINPVTEGVRYSLVGWCCGKPWR